MITPAGIAYTDLDGIEDYAHPGAVVVVSLHLLPDPRVRELAKVATVLAYNGFMERPDWQLDPVGRQMYGSSPGNWLWGGDRSNYSGTRMTNVRVGSDWGHHYAEEFLPWLLAEFPWLAGVFEDVYGVRLWSAVWGAMTPQERSDWTTGMLWWAPRIRSAVGDLILVANNTFPDGSLHFDGQSIENHAPANIEFWDGVLRKPWRNGGTHHLYIAKTEAGFAAYRDAATAGYRKADGSTAKLPLRYIAKQVGVAGAEGYARVGPVWGPFGEQPPPPPPPEPCAECEAALARTRADLEEMTDQRDAAISDREDAIAARNTALADLDRQTAETATLHGLLRDDLLRIRGSASSTAGDPWQRLHGIRGAADRALGRL